MLKFSVFYPGIELDFLGSPQNRQEVMLFLGSLPQSDYQPWERMEGKDQGLRRRFLHPQPQISTEGSVKPFFPSFTRTGFSVRVCQTRIFVQFAALGSRSLRVTSSRRRLLSW